MAPNGSGQSLRTSMTVSFHTMVCFSLLPHSFWFVQSIQPSYLCLYSLVHMLYKISSFMWVPDYLALKISTWKILSEWFSVTFSGLVEVKEVYLIYFSGWWVTCVLTPHHRAISEIPATTGIMIKMGDKRMSIGKKTTVRGVISFGCPQVLTHKTHTHR